MSSARAGHSDRDNLAAWLLQVCQQEEASPHVFCLAVNMMDRVLARVEVSTSQLPLLASSCLLVSWKIRQDKPISASSLVKYSQAAFLVEELLVRTLDIVTSRYIRYSDLPSTRLRGCLAKVRFVSSQN